MSYTQPVTLELDAYMPHFQRILTDLERRKMEEFGVLFGNEALRQISECGIDRRRGYVIPSANSLEHQIRNITKIWSISIFVSIASFNIERLFSPGRASIFVDHMVNSFDHSLNDSTHTSTAELPLLYSLSRLTENRVQLSTSFLAELETFVSSFIVLLLRPHVTSGVIRHNFHLRFIPYLRRLMIEIVPIIRTANSNQTRFNTLEHEIEHIRERVERYRRLETQIDLQLIELRMRRESIPNRDQLEKVFTYEWKEAIDESISCTVCMNQFEPNKMVSKLPCGHVFCETCISRWFQSKNTCPNCRGRLDQ